MDQRFPNWEARTSLKRAAKISQSEQFFQITAKVFYVKNETINTNQNLSRAKVIQRTRELRDEIAVFRGK